MPVETVAVRNTLDNILVLGSAVNAKSFVRWEAAGDPDGEDVQFVTGEMAQEPGFRKSVVQGLLVIEKAETDPSVAEALDRQLAAYAKRAQGRDTEAQDAIERTENRDVISQFCVGPDTRGVFQNCKTPVTVPEAKRFDKAPLCTKHAKFQSEFVPQEIVHQDGTKEISWLKVEMDKPTARRTRAPRK